MSVLNLLPRESNLRLPYHMLMGDDLKAVMEGEVNMESLNAWLDMAQVLKVCMGVCVSHWIGVQLYVGVSVSLDRATVVWVCECHWIGVQLYGGECLTG